MGGSIVLSYEHNCVVVASGRQQVKAAIHRIKPKLWNKRSKSQNEELPNLESTFRSPSQMPILSKILSTW